MKLSYRMLLASAVFAAAASASPASAKCMALTVTRPDGSTGAMVTVAPDSGSPDLDAAGYKDMSCGNLDKAAYLQKVCNPKSWGNSGMQRQFAIQAGISLVQLCSAARQDAGLPDLTPGEIAQRFLPPGGQVSAVVKGGMLSPAPMMKGAPWIPPGAVSNATSLTGGQ